MKLVKVTTSEKIRLIDIEGKEAEIAEHGIEFATDAGVICKTRKNFREYIEAYAEYEYAWKKDGTAVKYNWTMTNDAWLYMIHGSEFTSVEECEGFRMNDVKTCDSACLETAYDAVIYGTTYKFAVMDDEFLMIRDADEYYENEYDIDLDLIPEYQA